MENRRPKMDRADRAKQFMPFDALKGLREALAEKEHELTLVSRRELSEEAKAELDRKMCQIRIGDIISVEFFQRGEYVQRTGKVTRISANRREIRIKEIRKGYMHTEARQAEALLNDEERIRVDDICDLQLKEC